MQAWYENEAVYKHVGHVSFGRHAIYDFEVYIDLIEDKIVAMCHDDPEEVLALEDLIEFSKNYTSPEDESDRRALIDLLSGLGVERMLTG